MPSASYSDNLDEALSSLRDELPEEGHTLVVGNVMEYAVWLHDREGYYVFNPEKLVEIVRGNLEQVLESGVEFKSDTVELALEKAGFEYVNWLLELEGGTQPPIRSGEGARQATRGGWATITGNLASAFKVKVNDRGVQDLEELGPEPDPERDELEFP